MTRSYAKKAWPIAAAAVGGLIGFIVAVAGAWASAKGGGNWSWKNKSGNVALAFGAGLAIGAVIQVYFTQYEAVPVWQLSFSNMWKLGLAAGAAAAGGTVAGQIAKFFGSKADG